MTMMIINVMMIIKISINSPAALCGLSHGSISIFLKLHLLIIMIINSYHHDHGHHCQDHHHDVHLVMV